MESISQSHENSTATLWPPHGLSPVKTLEAESVHEVVGGRGATLAAAASAEGGGWLGGGGAANAWLAAPELRPTTRSAELAAQRGVWASGSLLEYQRAHQDRPAPHGPGWQMFTEEGYHLGGFLRGCSRFERSTTLDEFVERASAVLAGAVLAVIAVAKSLRSAPPSQQPHGSFALPY
jgi:hypothetical protein